jgi:UDP-N-acetylmuramoyl-L-alanyl-D-glutamate--2,6-diaminopimelate ligase
VVFTNLGRDHLDFHETEEAYFRAKAMLFEPERAAVAVVNADDSHGKLLLDAARLPTRPFTSADASDVEVGTRETRFRWRGVQVRLGLGGSFNVSNALAAATAAAELGIDPSTIAEGLASAPPVAGRFEVVDVGMPFTVVVDYAHTPDALDQVLREARRLTGHGVLVVFGCGGERDHSKRPMMGEIASRLADLAFLTDDNPRGEDPTSIIDEVRAGVRDQSRLVVERDRRAAIASALERAQPGDIVVIAGKGHETVQLIGTRVIPFDDREVAREIAGAR